MLMHSQFFYAPEVDGTGAAIGTINRVPLIQQQFGEIRAVLAGDAGD